MLRQAYFCQHVIQTPLYAYLLSADSGPDEEATDEEELSLLDGRSSMFRPKLPKMQSAAPGLEKQDTILVPIAHRSTLAQQIAEEKQSDSAEGVEPPPESPSVEEVKKTVAEKTARRLFPTGSASPVLTRPSQSDLPPPMPAKNRGNPLVPPAGLHPAAEDTSNVPTVVQPATGPDPQLASPSDMIVSSPEAEAPTETPKERATVSKERPKAPVAAPLGAGRLRSEWQPSDEASIAASTALPNPLVPPKGLSADGDATATSTPVSASSAAAASAAIKPVQTPAPSGALSNLQSAAANAVRKAISGLSFKRGSLEQQEVPEDGDGDDPGMTGLTPSQAAAVKAAQKIVGKVEFVDSSEGSSDDERPAESLSAPVQSPGLVSSLKGTKDRSDVKGPRHATFFGGENLRGETFYLNDGDVPVSSATAALSLFASGHVCGL